MSLSKWLHVRIFTPAFSCYTLTSKCMKGRTQEAPAQRKKIGSPEPREKKKFFLLVTRLRETSMHNLRIVAHIDSVAVTASSFLFSWPLAERNDVLLRKSMEPPYFRN